MERPPVPGALPPWGSASVLPLGFRGEDRVGREEAGWGNNGRDVPVELSELTRGFLLLLIVPVHVFFQQVLSDPPFIPPQGVSFLHVGTFSSSSSQRH